MLEEAAILQALQQGHLPAYKQIHQEYASMLYVFACKYVDNELAKDMVQDVFFAIWHDAKTVKISSSLKSYLFTAVRNNCLNHLKKQQSSDRYKNHALYKLQQVERSSETQSDRLLLENEIQTALHDCVEQFPQQCRTVFKLSRFEHKKNAEIAQLLSISTKTVEKHISTALKILREKMSKFLVLIISALSLFS